MYRNCSYTYGEGNLSGQTEIQNFEKHNLSFTLLSLEVDITSVDKFVKVCCALCSACQSVIPAD